MPIKPNLHTCVVVKLLPFQLKAQSGKVNARESSILQRINKKYSGNICLLTVQSRAQRPHLCQDGNLKSTTLNDEAVSETCFLLLTIFVQ